MKKLKNLKITFNSPLTLTFVILSCAVTILGMVTANRITDVFFTTYRGSLTSPLTYLRLLTHVFGHRNWSHFMGNAAFLLLLGPMLEEKYGPKMLLLVMTMTAIITGVINFIFFPYTGLCGASGIVFAFILLSSFTGFQEGELPLTFVLVALIYIGEQVFDGLFVRDNISNLSHIIGGLVGAAAGYKGARRR